MFEGQDLLYGKNMKVRKGKRKGHVKLDVVTDRNMFPWVARFRPETSMVVFEVLFGECNSRRGVRKQFLEKFIF